MLALSAHQMHVADAFVEAEASTVHYCEEGESCGAACELIRENAPAD
jgi:hypothetical protein